MLHSQVSQPPAHLSNTRSSLSAGVDPPFPAPLVLPPSSPTGTNPAASVAAPPPSKITSNSSPGLGREEASPAVVVPCFSPCCPSDPGGGADDFVGDFSATLAAVLVVLRLSRIARSSPIRTFTLLGGDDSSPRSAAQGANECMGKYLSSNFVLFDSCMRRRSGKTHVLIPM